MREVTFGPYVLETRLAVGGTAEVYLARHADPRGEPPQLVVKRLLPDFLGDEEGRTMFAREAALHASVRHDNVVKVFAAGETDDGEPYLAMEWVEGVDGYRLIRRTRQDGRSLPVPVAVHIAREVLLALDYVHSATDAAGTPLHIVHRDVTPSNVYLSKNGDVKLGDFGIARANERLTAQRAASAMLKGKFAYLAPEQVAGEEFDHRADLFSMATVLAELLLGEQLFPGVGQLAVLLAIRDCRIDALHARAGELPPGLYQALVKGLSKNPDDRFERARAFAEALAPFAGDPAGARAELGVLVREAMRSRSGSTMAAVRDSSSRMRAAAPVAVEQEERPTGEYTTLPSFVITTAGTKHGPWTFARLVEALATGEVGRADQVDYIGRGYASVADVEDLARFLPAQTPATSKLEGPGKPDATYDLSHFSMLEVLLCVLEKDDTGVLFAERGDRNARKELYFVRGRLHHVASSNASELLGEYLVRRGKLSRHELDMALAVLPRHNGRMGDTLISLGLVSPVDVFQAIREQGRDRVADLFMWTQGQASFYRNQTALHVEFPLDLDLPTLMLAGMEAAVPGESALERYRTRLHAVVGPGRRDRPGLLQVRWPPQVAAVEALSRRPKRLSELLSEATRGGQTTAGSVLRALDMLLAAHLLEIR